MDKWRVDRLADSKVDRAGFSCGDESLDRFFHNYALQYEKRHIGRTFVAVSEAEPNQAAGYFTIANSSVSFESVPIKLARHPIPTVLIARLAVDLRWRGMRLGEFLLFDALRRSLELSRSAGIFAIEVDAYQSAVPFYKKYGFESFLDNAQHLFLPIKQVERMNL
jgi:predicted GNAT family N-acyltransferase